MVDQIAEAATAGGPGSQKSWL